MLLVGLDAASQFTNFGYAIGVLHNGRIEVEDTGMLASRKEPDALRRKMIPRLRGMEPGLLALDAPLGWPAPLGSLLAAHAAGEVLRENKDRLFARETDRKVAEVVGKRPLEIGADKIARATHTALEVLSLLREQTKRPIPIAWTPAVTELSAIEVYPAATLKARGLRYSGYKKREQEIARREIAQVLRDEMPDLVDIVKERADVFDACLCMLAAKDFLLGETMRPTDAALARREGWIWVRAPGK